MAKDIAAEIMQALHDYADMTVEEMQEIVEDTAKECRDQIQATAPVRTGAYAKSWTATKAENTSTTVRVTVRSRDHYQLTHLLEFGHAKRSGGRVAARPHIAAARDQAEQNLERKLKEALGK